MLFDGDDGAGIRDRRLDLPAMADDRRVAEQTIDIACAEPRHLVRVEALERAPEGITLTKNREPRQARLKPFKAQLFVETRVVDDRPAPLVIVIPRVVGR